MIVFLFVLFSLGQLGRLAFFNPTLGAMGDLYFYEPFLAILLLKFIIQYKFEPIKEALRKFKSLFFFGAILVFSFIITSFSFNLQENLYAALYCFRLFLYILYFVYVNYRFKKNPKEVTNLKKGFTLFITITAVTSGLQYFLYPDLRNLYYLGWDPHLYRVFGVFFDTSIAASIFGLVIIILFFYKKLFSSHTWLQKSLLAIYSVLGLLTYSRALYVSIGIAAFYYLLSHKKYSGIIIGIALFAVSVILLPRPGGEGVNLSRTYSIISRQTDYNQALKLFKNSPIFGIGYNRISSFKTTNFNSNIPNHAASSFHSSFLIILATTGIIGLITFLYLLFQLASMSEASRIIILYLGVFSLADNILLHPFILFVLFSTISREHSRKSI